MTNYRSQISQDEIKTALEALIGAPYEEDGCLKFLQQTLSLCGAEITRDPLKDARRFVPVRGAPRFGDVAVFQSLPFEKYHVAFMIDKRWAFQSSRATNGVGRIDVTREPWRQALRGYYRHKAMTHDK